MLQAFRWSTVTASSSKEECREIRVFQLQLVIDRIVAVELFAKFETGVTTQLVVAILEILMVCMGLGIVYHLKADFV